MSSFQWACEPPLSVLIEAKGEANKEVLGFAWQSNKEGVVRDSGKGAVRLPSSPDLVLCLVAGLLFRVQDDSTVCKASVIQDKTSLGSGDILKDFGISWGR
jgi:hypothetical protein